MPRPYSSRDGVCAEPGCNERIHARLLCRSHYSRRRRDRIRAAKPPKLVVIQAKVCAECGRIFEKSTHTERGKWEARRCCSALCHNAFKGRGYRPLRRGELSKRVLGRREWKHQRDLRAGYPRWASWWEDERRREDYAEESDRAQRIFAHGPTCRLADAPTSRGFTGVVCTCGTTYVSHTNREDDYRTPRCSDCTRSMWRGGHRRRARHYGVRYEPINRREVFTTDGWACQICGVETTPEYGYPHSATLDHIIPVSRGGHHTRDNVQTACAACNSAKGASLPDEMELAAA